MSRVNNEAAAVANRLIEKTIALASDHAKYLKLQKRATVYAKELIKDEVTGEFISDETYDLWVDATDHLKRIETDRASLVNTIIGMHEKMISADFARFTKFAVEFASSLIADASAEKVAQFQKMFPDSESF